MWNQENHMITSFDNAISTKIETPERDGFGNEAVKINEFST
jgi:hypothetical protein